MLGLGQGKGLAPAGARRESVKLDELHQALMEETITTANLPFRTSSSISRVRATVSRLGRCYVG